MEGVSVLQTGAGHSMGPSVQVCFLSEYSFNLKETEDYLAQLNNKCKFNWSHTSWLFVSVWKIVKRLTPRAPAVPLVAGKECKV